MNIACPKCDSNDVQSAAMIVATGTTTGKNRLLGSGIGSTLEGGFGGGWYRSSSTNTNKTDLAQRYSFDPGPPVAGCFAWLFGIGWLFCLIFPFLVDGSDDFRNSCFLFSFSLLFSTVLLIWHHFRTRNNKVRTHKETIDRLWVCLRCGCEFFP